MSKEKDLVKAFRILVNLSEEPQGPDLDTALHATDGLNLPKNWVEKVLLGWQRYYKRYNRPKDKALIKKTPVRFLAIRMLTKLNLTACNKPCRLCGLEVLPGRLWHKECWKALEPETAGAWPAITSQVCRRDNYICQGCDKDVLDFRAARRYGKRPYSIDHINALCLGGEHSIENLQLLCIECHKKKSKSDIKKLASRRKQFKN